MTAPHFAAHTEMQDASRIEGMDFHSAPGAASIEIAKILTVFDGKIDDEWRHVLVVLGGALLKLQDELEKEEDDG